MFSAFDLTDNYYFPINEYLSMSINQITKLNLGRKMKIYNNSQIEFILDDNNFNYSIISSKKIILIMILQLIALIMILFFLEKQLLIKYF